MSRLSQYPYPLPCYDDRARQVSFEFDAEIGHWFLCVEGHRFFMCAVQAAFEHAQNMDAADVELAEVLWPYKQFCERAANGGPPPRQDNHDFDWAFADPEIREEVVPHR